MSKRLLLCLVFVMSACAVASSTPDEEQQGIRQDAPTVAFVGVNVVPMDEEQVLSDHTVIVEGDRIVTVGPASEVEVPEGAIVVEGEGRYLMPGLAEMHGHIPPPSAPEEYVNDVLFLYFANGITTVRGMLGHDNQLALRDRVNGSAEWAPSLYLAGPSFSGGSISSPEQAEAKVRQQKEEGWDLLKVHPGLTRAEYDAMAETANEVGIRFGGHVPEEVGLAHAIEMNQETYDHLDGYINYLDGQSESIDDARLEEIVQMSREAGVWVVPTMVLWETLYGTAELEKLRNLPELKYMPSDQVNQWIQTHEQRLNNPNLNLDASQQRIENRMRILKALSDGGVKILMGTDAPQQFSVPGFSLHAELERMADAGMTPFEILVSGTRNVGEYFANTDAFGTIAPGQRADLVLVNDNPLEDISNVADRAGVMIRGHWVTQEDIQARLDQIAN